MRGTRKISLISSAYEAVFPFFSYHWASALFRGVPFPAIFSADVSFKFTNNEMICHMNVLINIKPDTIILLKE